MRDTGSSSRNRYLKLFHEYLCLGSKNLERENLDNEDTYEYSLWHGLQRPGTDDHGRSSLGDQQRLPPGRDG